MKPTQQQCIEAALRARGETLCFEGKVNRWTRRYAARRSSSKALRAATVLLPYWYTGKDGSLRVGDSSSRLSVAAQPESKAILIAEGLAILKGQAK